MLEFFHDGMWLCWVYVCQTEEKWGDLMFSWWFSVKMGNLMTYLPKHPCLNIWYDPFILPLFAWWKLSPKLNGCDFLSCNLLLHVFYIETTFSICVWFILRGDQTRKRVFLRLRDTVFQSEERTEEEGWRHQEKSVNIFIEYLLSFCAAKSYEFVSFIQKNNIT